MEYKRRDFDPSRPITATPLFQIGYLLYGVAMLASIIWTVFDSEFRAISIPFVIVAASWIATFLVVGVLVWAGIFTNETWLLKQEPWFSRKVDSYLLPVLSPVVYVGGFWVVTQLLSNHPQLSVPVSSYPIYTLAAVVQGMVLLVIVGVSAAPLIPSLTDLPGQPEIRIEYLQMDMRNWWRYAQLVTSFFFAIGVGIAATGFMNSGILSDVVVNTLAAMVGVSYLGFYTFLKITFVNKKMKTLMRRKPSGS